ncbi:LysR family transcriptional regulator [Brenneria izbisi]|uniref:LysR family transcriptional regulator n=1 Tax=Brenneria izbisi TaxID=2939450 RepID=A0AA41XWF6_9GAMM|nr:LysR family transcriptional regulator [Brenneria izbisi]MCV9877652.1 LysR family transcriptional regulator [Brenneria izbisi]MCV9880783.1 LysR family transcriptional regulator [Brenneria izbisi]
MDRLTSMSVFVRAVETGSFTAAAEVLTMSPQLVGKHVSMLEQHLGVRLINRTTRQHSLTESGRHFYERCKIILAEVEAAESFAAQARAIPSGRLRINAPVTFGINALSPLLPRYLKAYPDISIELTLSNRMVDLIDEGYDMVFRVGELIDSGLMAKKLAPYQLVTCASPAYLASAPPLTQPQDLVNHECLIFTHTTLRTQWVYETASGIVQVPVTGRLLIDSGEAMTRAALSGMGVMMQPVELVNPLLATGELVRVLAGYNVPSRPLHALYAPDRRLTPKLRSFLDFVTAEFGNRHKEEFGKRNK